MPSKLSLSAQRWPQAPGSGALSSHLPHLEAAAREAPQEGVHNTGRALLELWGQGWEGLHLGRMKVGSAPDPSRGRRGGVMEEAHRGLCCPLQSWAAWIIDSGGSSQPLGWPQGFLRGEL